MRSLSLSACLFLFFSCFGAKPRLKPETKTKPESFFKEELFSVYQVGEINPAVINNEGLDLPPGVWSPAARFSVLANDFERIDYCLVLKAPFKLEPGQLKFVAAGEQSCGERLFAEPLAGPKSFYNISARLEEAKFTLRVDQEKRVYRFVNMEDGDVRIAPDVESQTLSPAKLLRDGEACFTVADDCSATEDRCGRCEGGSYYIKNSACQSAYSKVCGRDTCGQKGAYACIRGHVSTGVKDYCIQDSPVGFCSGNNRVGCVNGTLICE